MLKHPKGDGRVGCLSVPGFVRTPIKKYYDDHLKCVTFDACPTI